MLKAAWDYSPGRRIAGSFVNYTGGGYDGFHVSSTSGLALGSIHWKVDRPYIFFENEASYKNLDHGVSILDRRPPP